MQKIQVLLPEPVLADLREIAAAEDRPLSEVVRRAAEQMVRTYPTVRRRPVAVRVRTFDGGALRVADATNLRALAYEEEGR
jgi:Ribbon-helix-helix protein, copG family